jgi:hypothetical protein
MCNKKTLKNYEAHAHKSFFAQMINGIIPENTPKNIYYEYFLNIVSSNYIDAYNNYYFSVPSTPTLSQ